MSKARWQIELANATLSIDALCQQLAIDPEQLPEQQKASQDFPLRVPQAFINKMQKGNPNDPLLLQVLPQADELLQTVDFSADPLQEENANPIPGLLHKYHNRVLLIATGACAIHCRYCFRRHFPYDDNNPGTKGWQQALEYVRQHRQIDEVILSGGDPLSLNDKILGTLLDAIAAIPHVKRIRLHTRLPVVLPKRITPELIQGFKRCRLPIVMVIHANHPNELGEDVCAALARLHQANVRLLNQTVLLKGINDHADTLTALSHKLFDHQVQPYYLHLLDKVQGAAHFDVPLKQAKQLYHQLQSQLSGYLVPKLVREQASRPYKTAL